MHTRLAPCRILLLGMTAACAGADATPSTTQQAPPPGGSDTGDGDPIGPCDDGGWGSLAIDPDLAIHVRATGSRTGTGSPSDPVSGLDEALVLTRAGTQKTIFVGPGTFATDLSLSGDLGGGTTDDDTQILGCAAGETILQADDADAPVLRITGATGVAVADLTVWEGTRGVQIWGGAEVRLVRLQVLESMRSGVIVSGPETLADLQDVEILDPQATLDDAGVSAAYGLVADGAVVSMTGGGVYRATRVGIFADRADLSLDGVTVEDTAQDGDDLLGRGIHIQDLSQATIEDTELSGNHDAGLSSIQSLSLVLDGVRVDATALADVGDGSTEAGDGIVVSQGGDDLDEYPASTFDTQLSDCTVTGSERAGIVFEAVSVSVLSGNTAGSDNAESQGGNSIYGQNGAEIDIGVSDSWVDVDTLALTPFGFNDQVLDAESLIE